jgi:serine/threonine protein kinase
MRSDIYAIGKTLLYMLTGVEPEQHSDGAAMEILPEPIRKIIQTSTSFSPESRYSTVNDMKQDLRVAKDMFRDIHPEPNALRQNCQKNPLDAPGTIETERLWTTSLTMTEELPLAPKDSFPFQANKELEPKAGDGTQIDAALTRHKHRFVYRQQIR